MLLLDFGRMMSLEKAKELNMRPHQVWVDMQTHRNMRDSLAAVISALWAVPDDLSVAWEAMSELQLEKRFARIRTQFPNSQFTITDFWRASAKLMKEDRHSWETGLPEQKPCSKRLTHETFVAVAERSLEAATKLSSMCSGLAMKKLSSDFYAFTSRSEDSDADDVEKAPQGQPVCLWMFLAWIG